MPYSLRVKSLAYQEDPVCWISYSGFPVEWKRRMDVRRVAALNAAQRFVNIADKIINRQQKERPMLRINPSWVIFDDLDDTPNDPKPYHSPPMKINMMIHFATTVGPFAPEPQRRSPAYTKFIKQLLNDGLVERPTQEERAKYPGWAYKATARGKAYLEALKAVQLPVATTTWAVPQ